MNQVSLIILFGCTMSLGKGFLFPRTPPTATGLPATIRGNGAIPFLDRPPKLDGSLPGDAGFDPLGFSNGSEEALLKYREAEVKHGRLAMLAAAGWPISELFDRKIAASLHLPTVLDATDRAPSLLNGGLGKISPLYWGSVLALASAIELYGIKRGPGEVVGDLGFDPLGLYPDSPEARFEMQTKEIKNGRLAMMGVLGFAVQEAVTRMGVIDETPMFFSPPPYM